MRKFFFLILFLSFSLEIYAEQPDPVPLPTFPKRKEAILLQKQKTENQKKIDSVIWSLNWHTGIQQINIKKMPQIAYLNALF